MLGGVLAVLIVLVVGEGPRTDGFFAAYSLYLFFALFGATLRVALVPLMGSVADEAAWRERTTTLLGRLAGLALVVAGALLLLSPLLARALVPGLGGGALRTATASLAVLALASYCQITASALAAALAAARRFTASALLYVAASAVSVVMATGLMLVLGVVGAALGVLAGSVMLLAGHRVYLARFGFHARPAPGQAGRRATLRLLVLAAGGAAIALAQQLALSIALAVVSTEPGAVTAYSYAYFVGALLAGVTINVISLVMLPDVLERLRVDGERAAVDGLGFVVPVAVYLFVPVAAAYAAFGRPLLEFVLGGSLGPASIDLLWDASRLFLAMNLTMALVAPPGAVVLALRRYRALVAPAIALLVLHAVGVVAAGALGGPVAVAAVHAGLGATLAIPVLALGFGRDALRVLRLAAVRALPALALALVFPLLALLAPEPGPGAALVLALAGVAAYFAVGSVAWPSVGGRALTLLRGRGTV